MVKNTKNKIFVIAALALIMFLIMGIASAGENSTEELKVDDSDDAGEIEILINNAGENDTIKLDEKTYNIVPKTNSSTSILINKSLTIEGTGETVIDGNYTSLYLNSEEPKKDENDTITFGWFKGYIIKNTGKTITFNNITFKNINLVSWHEMHFNNCNFINAKFTSYELNNTFNGCTINNSTLTLSLLIGSQHMHDFNISGCKFNHSALNTETIYTSTYIAIVGGALFYILNHVNLADSILSDTNIEMDHTNMTVTDSRLENGDLYHRSNLLKIKNSELNNPNIELIMSGMSADNTTINNSTIKAIAGYFSRGSAIYLKKSRLNKSDISIEPNSISSSPSSFTSVDSAIENLKIYASDTKVSIKASELFNTHMLLFFSDLLLENSTFYNNGSIEDAIKTKNYTETYNNNKGIYENVSCIMKTNYTSLNSYFVNNTGRYLIKNSDIEFDNTYILLPPAYSIYYFNDAVIFTLTDNDGRPVVNTEINVQNSEIYDVVKIKTDENGNAWYKPKNAGKLKLNVYYESPGYNIRKISYGIEVNIEIKKVKTVVKAPKVTNKFKKSQYFRVTVKNKITKKPVSKVKVKIKVYTGKKYKTFTVKTDKKGTAKISTKKLKAGKHKVVISSGNKNYIISKKSSIKIKK